VIACAEAAKLEPFISWCHKGPMMAKVNKVDITEPLITEAFSRFEIR